MNSPELAPPVPGNACWGCFTGFRGACVALVMVATSSAALAQKKEDLDILRAKIETLRERIASAEDTRNEARDELRESELSISKANRALRDLAREREAARAQLRTIDSRRDAAERERSRRERELGAMLAATHRQGTPSYPRLLLSGNDPNQAARDLYYLSHIGRAQSEAIVALRADIDQLRAIEAKQREQTRAIAMIESAEKSNRATLLEQRAARRLVLERASARIKAQQKEVEVLRRDELRLAKLVTEIAKVIAESTGRVDRPASIEFAARPFANLRGNLRMPTRGTVTNSYGAARPEGGPNWKGIFIRAKSGEEVHAVAPGRVVYAEWMRGFGNLLIVDHGGEYLSIYGNNEALLKSVGDGVQAGELLATVGTSGGGQETGLYFELRHEGRAFDPARWLARR